VKKQHIFITARYRTGSSYLYNLFSHCKHIDAFYEPLHENLIMWINSPHYREIEPNQEYFEKYKNLDQSIFLSKYHPDFLTKNFILNSQDKYPELKSYIEFLLTNNSKPKVLQFNRLDFRLGWVKFNFPEVLIVNLRRNPRDVYCSYLKSLVKLRQKGLKINKISNLFNLELYIDLLDENRIIDYKQKSMLNDYQKIYLLNQLSNFWADHYADVIISYENLVKNTETILEDILSKIDNESIQLPGKLISPYHSSINLWSQYQTNEWFEECETFVDSLLVNILKINLFNSDKENQFDSPIKSKEIIISKSPIILIDGVFFQLYKTGIARVWKSLLEQWANTDFANQILVLDRANTAPKINGIRYRTIQEYNYNNTEADKRMLQQICNEEKAELFISSYYTTPLTTPSVFMAYDMIPEVLGGNLNEPMWQEKHKGINHALGYIAISHNTAQDLTKFFPQIKAESVTVAHCGVDTATFFPPNPAEVQQFKAKYQIQKPYFLLTSLGSYKNTTLFFEGFSRLAIRDNFAVVVTGAASKIAEQVQQQLQGQSVNLTIHPLDLSDDELRLAYAGAIALVYPSKYEGFGMPVIEAMACGCPVITTRNASLPEAAGNAALYINDSDVREMTNALLKVLDLETRSYLINEGLKQAQKFSWATMAKTIEKALLKTIQLSPSNLGDLGGKLRIGYISPDFRDHPVGNFIEPIIRRHDRTQVKVYCYSETRKVDGVTNAIKNKADVWRETKGLSDQEVADLIKQDQIDILIDLAGHTEGNRLGALALKPAPIQATYLGYFASTGLSTIDYWITDNYIHPQDTQEKATEQIWRLPRCYLGYRSRPEAPFVNDSPCLSQDFITFGSFNNYSKLNPLVLQTWAEILRQIPNSQLIIKNDHQDLDDPEERASIEEYLQANGLNIKQIKLVSRQTTSMNYLALYHSIDIHLDIFPYNGCTTTCDALGMGVPVLTLAGTKYIQRMGATILTTVGLEDWIAHSTQEYIQKAVKFAKNKPQLQQLRTTMRDRLLNSPLCDLDGITQSLENAYLQMCRKEVKTG
jgi:glycosyltransferase involved in cell wall biosynthesis